MSELELPHSPDCLVCGRDNPHGLRLSLRVRPADGAVITQITPTPRHTGFAGVVHGGLLATVADEAMVWAASWAIRRFCMAGELAIRFRRPAEPGMPLRVEASAIAMRSRLIETTATIRLDDPAASDPVASATTPSALIATATGKYIPVSDDHNRAFLASLIADKQTKAALDHMLAARTPALASET
jgi:acyl-coenzyme A thioesterase PaaI-like protein